MSNGSTDPRDGESAVNRRSALDWVAQTVGNDALLQELHTRAQRRTRRRAFVASGVLATLVLSFVVTRFISRDIVEQVPAQQLQVSLPRQQILPDGSVAELREGAQIEVDFSGAQRRIALVQGEAHFSVRKDPAKPFIVHALGVEVRAVGTAFAVQMAPRGIEVLVTEGRVAVDHAAARDIGTAATPATAIGGTAYSSPQAAPLAFVSAGEGTLIEASASRETTQSAPPPQPQVTAIAEAEMTERLSWRVPRLELSGTPLDVAIQAFNRHSKVKLAIGDPSLSRLRVSGIVRADQADALISLLAANFEVTAELRGGETVLLRRSR